MKQNFKWISSSFKEGFARVELSENNWNFIDTKGNLLSKQNFEWVGDFQDGFAIVKLSSDGTWYYIDKDFNFYDFKTKTLVSNPF